MIIALSQIGPAGLRRSLRMALSGFPRLTEQYGPQPEHLLGEVLLKRRGSSVELTGTMQATVRLECNRCLDPVAVEINEPVQVTLAPETAGGVPAGNEVQLSSEELDVSFFSGEAIDLTVVLEDELLLMIPEPACEESDEGMCTCCGRKVAEVLETEAPDEAFHPLAGLRSLIREPERNER